MNRMRPISFALIALSFLLPGSVEADPPAGYYATVDNSSSSALRISLHDIIDDHTYYPYSYVIINVADEDPLNSANVLVVYENYTYLKQNSGAANYNREHTWPSSYGLPDGSYPYSDYHHLMASKVSYNSDRGSRPFDYCVGCEELWTVDYNGEGRGTGIYPGNSNWRSSTDGPQGSWETWIGRRGDIARAMFYMDVRYEGGGSEPDLVLTDNRADIVAADLPVAYMGLLSVLLEWHVQDPPSAAEMLRNDVVASYQGNRNPFVDHPEWAECIFLSTGCGLFINGFESGDTTFWSAVVQ